MKHRPVLDVSELPTYAFGARSPMWWGTLGFCVLEGTGFALAAGAYLYLAFLNPQWPLSAPPPDLIWSSLVTVVLIVSIIPNYLSKKFAEKEDLPRVQVYLIVVLAFGLAAIGLRFLEFGGLHVKWDQNAYGSLLWALLGLHTVHIITDVVDTIVLTVLMFTRHAHGKRFSDVGDNAFYWNFVVLSWLPIYALLYWGPRL
ncbi:cytochrome c oxidase subunit 3 [Microvirga thermotolerans]|uniref:Cytochrome C oxidase subunit III n=1 Tax=Microvirga thermotolerans TaxID=2651334 RepID=A0A5P9JYJ2_9HYPH|nr:cytochrome c oxidase subunit 3 [Microvirga thermotolerans]QFU17503.1 cytochrome C oxidase subunit III [Microvirga thermotolerans]